MSIQTLKNDISAGAMDKRLQKLYKEDLPSVRARFCHLCDLYEAEFGDGNDLSFFSAPGRTEVCGNHTDHNHGEVLAAAINLDAVALAQKNDTGIVRIKSENYAGDTVDIRELSPVAKESGKSVSLVRGVIARFKQLGYKIGGFNAVTVNKVLKGSGMSSSAAFEVLVGTVLNYLYNDGKISAVEIAQIAQYAENEFFGKPCGLMDQMACSVGGFVQIDFRNPAAPVITPVNFDFDTCGHALCIVDTRADHADLTDEYASIRREMEAVAGYFGKACLREVAEQDVMANIKALKDKYGERAVLRAMHFYADNRRVQKEAEALSSGDFDTFKRLTVDSGNSSYQYNQNVYAASMPQHQPVSLALAVSEYLLKDKGAWRVHGGGFAGTIQAFVPMTALDEYKTAMENIFGGGACYVLSIRNVGGTRI